MQLDLSGDRKVDNPTRDDIVHALRELSHADGDPFIILADDDGSFIQTYKYAPGEFLLEYREPDDTQFRVEEQRPQDVERAFLSFLAHDDKYKSDYAWEDITEDVNSAGLFEAVGNFFRSLFSAGSKKDQEK